MFLRSLDMKGFKSFADPTTLEFEPGITVVVGPNGSGKSNVVDAVTWVLGAQGPRSLRSQKMEDVIFAGTASRPALGRAEVSLTIDNASGRLPVDMAEVTVTRTLFRTGESEYAINGVPCRLLDVQDLLSDSGVGRQQHMIVGQGQLDTVLNARPEERRSIVEEAAGVLKHRRRRERAERRLEGTRENLERLGDLVREVRRQIRPLERQAAAARAHSKLSDDLRAARLRAAREELDDLSLRGNASKDQLAALAAEERLHRDSLTELDRQAASAAAELSSRRDEELAAALGRLQGLVQRAKGAEGMVQERSRAVVAAREAAVDVDVVSSLEAESANAAAELATAESERDQLQPEFDDIDRQEQRLGEAEHAFGAEWRDGSDQQRDEEALGLAEGRLDLLRRSEQHAQSSLDALRSREASLGRYFEELGAELEKLAARQDELESETARILRDQVRLEQAEIEAHGTLQQVEQAATDSEKSRHRSAARAEALERALEELHGAGGGELLEGVDGVVGKLVDLVEIDAGWEPAFEAAAGAAVAAVVVQGKRAAHEALLRLRDQGVAGAVLAARSSVSHPSPSPSAVWGAEPVRPHVRTRRGIGVSETEGLGRVVDALVGTAVRVDGLEQAIDVALERPDIVVVTAEGDRFAASGWRVRSGARVVTAAAVEESHRQSADAARAADVAAAQLSDARRAHEEARLRATDAVRRADHQGAAALAIAADRRRIEAERSRCADEIADVTEQSAAAQDHLSTEVESRRRLEGSIPDLRAAVVRAASRAHEAAETWSVLQEGRRALLQRRQAADVRLAELDERRRVLRQRLTEVDRRLEGHAEEREVSAARRTALERDSRVLSRLGELAIEQADRLDQVLGSLRDEYRSQVERVHTVAEMLETIRRRRSDTESRLSEVTDRAGRSQRDATEVAVRIDSLTAIVRRELGVTPEQLASAPVADLPDGLSAKDHAANLEERLRSLGPVNPLALDELSLLEERQHELEVQVEDVRSARRELQNLIRSLDDEIVQTFTAAMTDVNEHFSSLVDSLFPGGTGRLVMTEPDDLLNTGVDVEVRPSGRNVRRVSLLSGGERSLAALAFLFAVFRSRPSPFYFLDEVEAALDDVNLTRFLGLVREFRHDAQLLIVSHQKRTMETADALYGVTMAPGGSSLVVSQRTDDRHGAGAVT